jgi:hypothetical protein
MKTMSERATRLQPSPTAGPFTAATIGTRQATMPVTICRPWARVWRRSGVLGQLVEVGEVPAGREGAPVAREHAARASSSASICGNSAGQPGVQLVVGGVQLSGRFSVTTRTGRRRDLELGREGRRCS